MSADLVGSVEKADTQGQPAAQVVQVAQAVQDQVDTAVTVAVLEAAGRKVFH